MSKIYGTYEFKHFANKGKIEKIKAVLKEYRKTAKDIANFLWTEFFKNRNLPHKKKISIKHIPSNLSERYKYVCLWQIYGVLESYISILQSKFVKIVLNSNLNRDDKLILLALNNHKAWLKYEGNTITAYDGKERKKLEVKDFHKLISKKIFKRLLKTNRKPRFKNISMHLDGKVVEFLSKQENKAKSFDYWIKVSTLEKGNPVYIPLKKNSYAESLEGEFLNFCQVVERNGSLEFRIVKELEKKKYIPKTDTVAIDLGLNPLFATDKGDLIGRYFLSFLTELDEKITKRMAFLQKNGIKPIRRSSLKEFLNTNLPKKKILKVLLRQYLERFKGCWSAPLELFNGNPYFRDYLEKFLNPQQSLP